MKNISKFSLTALALLAFISTGVDAAISVNAVNVTGVNVSGVATASSGASVSASVNTNLDTSVWSATQVESDDQLKAYSQTVSQKDTSVSDISSADSSVSVSFKRPAKLFGFIPVHLKEKATVNVDAEGKSSVTVTKSWWSFLTSSNLKSDDLSSRIASKVASEGSLSANATLSASAKAKILSDIQVAASTVYSASVETK